MNSNSPFSENFPLIKKDEAQLRAYAEKYPWCSIAQLSLLTHYQTTNSLQFEEHATKTALFFNNTNWLNWQLHLLSKEIPIGEGRLEVEKENMEQPIFNMHDAHSSEEIMRADPETFPEDEGEKGNMEQPVFNMHHAHSSEEITTEEPETFPEAEEDKENIEQPVFDTHDANSTEEIMRADPETFPEAEEEKENIEQPVFNSPDANSTEEIMPAEPDNFQEPEEEKENIEQPVFNISPLTNTTEDIITFEPLHTTDYFASQGIRLTDEPVSNDKLGSQMKSFTEWLKSMKKTHKISLPPGDEQTDKNIQQIAENSNVDADIVTEAMADVLVKQNKNEKAIEVYEKLSLTNPSKSAYFAAKIDSLKTP